MSYVWFIVAVVAVALHLRQLKQTRVLKAENVRLTASSLRHADAEAEANALHARQMADLQAEISAFKQKLEAKTSPPMVHRARNWADWQARNRHTEEASQ